MIKTKEIIIYSTDTCPWCDRAKEFLKQHNIKFKEKNVADDGKARKELIEKSGQLGVPVLIIEGHAPIIGFDVKTIKKILQL